MRLLRRKPPAPLEAPPPRRLRELEIVTARLIRAGFAGQYHAAFHGRGIEFAQVREYQPGDDIRTIDWNVTARSGMPHVKQFVEERDLSVVIVLDASSSMSFGSLDRRKIDLAAELTAVFAFAALFNGDRVGLLVCSGGECRFLPPVKGRTHVQLLVRRAIEAAKETSGRIDLAAAAEFLQRVTRRRGIVIVISDFLDTDFQQPLQRLNRSHDVVALALGDPREQRFPARGLVTLVDAESGARRTVDLARNDVLGRALARQKSTFERFRAIGVDAVELSTAVPYERRLLAFFRDRIGRRR